MAKWDAGETIYVDEGGNIEPDVITFNNGTDDLNKEEASDGSEEMMENSDDNCDQAMQQLQHNIFSVDPTPAELAAIDAEKRRLHEESVNARRQNTGNQAGR